MNTQAIKAAIKSKLLEVSGVENVYLNEPRMQDLADIMERALQADSLYFQYWMIRRLASRPETVDSAPGQIPVCVTRWYHRYIIILHVAYREGAGDVTDSCIYFDNLVDAVLTALADERTYGNTIWTNTRPMELVESDYGLISGEMLTHQAVFGMEMIENQTVDYQ